MNDPTGERPLQVLTVTHSLSRRAGGLFTSVRRLAQSVAERGADVRVYGLLDEDFDRDAGVWDPVPVRAYPACRPRSLGHAPGLHADLVRDLRPPSVLHLQGLWKITSRTCLSVSRQHDIPRVISPRGMLDSWALRQSAARKRLALLLYEGRNLRSAGCIHVLCEAELRQVRDFGLTQPVAVIPNGIDIPDTGPGEAPTAEPAPASWKSRRVLLFLSRVHPKKGLVPLVRALARVAPQHEDWVLAVAGPEEAGHGEELRRLVAELRVEDRVSMVGPQHGAAKTAWLRRANAFVLPSFSEGFPMSVLEALAHGLPAIITPQCNFPEAAVCGAALSAEPEEEALAGALDRLMGLPEPEREAMGRKGQALVRKNYLWEDIAAQMVAVYEWLLGRGRRPDCVMDSL